jgi:hypothetical protein
MNSILEVLEGENTAETHYDCRQDILVPLLASNARIQQQTFAVMLLKYCRMLSRAEITDLVVMNGLAMGEAARGRAEEADLQGT